MDASMHIKKELEGVAAPRGDGSHRCITIALERGSSNVKKKPWGPGHGYPSNWKSIVQARANAPDV